MVICKNHEKCNVEECPHRTRHIESWACSHMECQNGKYICIEYLTVPKNVKKNKEYIKKLEHNLEHEIKTNIKLKEIINAYKNDKTD